MKGQYKITVVLLTWQRLSTLPNMLRSLSNQTYKNFDIRISNANLAKIKHVEKVVKMFDGHLNIEISHDGNDIFAFRRLSVGKDLAERGTNIVLFIDDDVQIPNNYIEQCLRYYEEKSYKSGFAWRIDRGGSDYYKYRTRIHDPNEKVHYCGTGMSMIDASIFLDPRLIRDAPPEAIRVEDLWISYFAQRVLKWKLAAMPLQNVQLGGADQVALYKRILKEKYTEKLPDKSDFMRLLVRKYKWKL
jgi:glycosyltransferase involved in cell wall biosynthesis